MKRDDKNTLTAKDICSIIKASAKSGLTKLVYQDLHLEFSHTTTDIVGLKRTETLAQTIEDIQPQMSFPVDEVKSAARPEDEVDELEDMHLATTNPELWEQRHLESINNAPEDGHQ